MIYAISRLYGGTSALRKAKVRRILVKNLHGAIKKTCISIYFLLYYVASNLFQERGVPVLWLALLKAN